MELSFKKAEKEQSKLRLALTGPSGSGKTHSALLIASALGKKIALIDTENYRASLKAGEPDIPDFDIINITRPYTIQKYLDRIRLAVDKKYDVLIIDSITHAWAGDGGLLEQKTNSDINDKFGNSYTHWAPITKEHEQFKAMLLNCDIHLIVTMRSKQDYILVQNEKGKMVPQKVGLAPIQREGMEYEFSFVFNLDMEHNATVSKTDYSALDGKTFIPSAETGRELMTWTKAGTIQGPREYFASPAQVQKAKSLVEVLQIKQEEVDRWFIKYNVKKWEEFSPDDMEKAISFLEKKAAPPIQKAV